MQVKDVMAAIEHVAPTIYQESYDNCGLQIGNASAIVTGVLIALDVTEEVIDEAVQRNCNMVVAHHPLIFSGLKRIIGRNYVEKIVQKAIKNDINIYAAHTNMDNMYAGVNGKIAQKLMLQNTKILQPKTNILSKLYTYAPHTAVDDVREALFAAGGGNISKYKECSFNTNGAGTFRAREDANPAIGQAGGKREWVEEVKIELIVEKHAESKVLDALRQIHPYEEVAYELIPLPNPHQEIGAGMIGDLLTAMTYDGFMNMLKKQMKADCIRHTATSNKRVSRVAVCGGSGSFLLKDAISAGADVFVTADFKYHQFFDAEGKIVIADIGHYESEQFTSEIFEEILNKNFPTFAILLSNINTNPVKYFF